MEISISLGEGYAAKLQCFWKMANNIMAFWGYKKETAPERSLLGG